MAGRVSQAEMNRSEVVLLIRRWYLLLARGASLLQSPLLLLVRLYWGWSFIVAGWGKLQNHAQAAEYFASLHIPLPGVNAWLASATECGGGALLLLGLASRLTALPLICTMAVAYLTAERERLQSFFSDTDKFTGAAPFLFLYAAVLILVFGPGCFSIDHLLARRFRADRDVGSAHF